MKLPDDELPPMWGMPAHNRKTPPAQPLDLPDSVRAWVHGRVDRAVSRRGDGSVTLTMFLPNETLTARFPTGADAAAALAGEVRWTTASTAYTPDAERSENGRRAAAARRRPRFG